MHNILAILKLTLLLSLRKGTFWGILVLISGISSLIFLVSSGDNILVNELKLRLQYSYAITYSLLTLVIISISCFSMRSELDGRQIHMLTSYPVSRKEIWIGKWLGIVSIAFVSELILFSSLALCCFFYSQTFPKEEIQNAGEYFQIIKFESRPVQKSFKELTNERIKTLIAEKKMKFTDVDATVRDTIFSQLLREEQLVPPNGKKTWKFNLGQRPIYGDTIDLKFKFYAESKRKPIQGTWMIHAPGKVEAHETDFEVFPFTANTVSIPVSQIPDSGKFEVTLKGKNQRDIIVSKNSGLRIYYEDGSLQKNLLKALVFQLTHLGVTAAVGLTAGVALTFAVAAFISIVLYIMSVSSGIFEVIVQGMTNSYHLELADQIAIYVINSGLWLTKGLQPPAIIASLSSGISIPTNDLLLTWLPAVTIYGCVAAFLGIYLLTRKELDKILT